MVRNAVGKAALGGIGRVAVRGDLRVKLFRRGQHGGLRSGGHKAFKASAFGIGVLAAGDPDSAEVGMAVGSARRGSAEIGLAILGARRTRQRQLDRKSTRLNSSHLVISYAVFCLKKKKKLM